MPGKEIFPARNASTATSLAALTTAGIPPPAGERRAREADRGIAPRFELEEVEPADFDEVEPARSRCAPARDTTARRGSETSCRSCRAGPRTSRPRTRPGSGRSDCGWITTSIFSGGAPKRKCASMISSPLFIIVAESIVIFGPIFQVGCASASSTVIASKVPRSRCGTVLRRPSGRAARLRRSRRRAAPGGSRSAPSPRE